MFRRLVQEPYLLRHHEIAGLTLRQIFEHYFHRDDNEKDRGGKAVADSPKGSNKEQGARGIPGIGLDRYDCWKPVPGEAEDESVVPVGVVMARYYSMGFELCRRGMLGNVRKDDFEEAKIFLDGQWRAWELKNKVDRKSIRAEFDRETELWRQRVQAAPRG